ncbi:MAG TPA: ADP-glyceromanno-heptose 6-epimerase [Longimicrobiaceae bacterium]|nr:ADP-glyceromanno-heptose 6-epimerase [Longimicrobiaceae bacterium]
MALPPTEDRRLTTDDLSRKRILLTGGAGFIGSALLWDLNRHGSERVVVSDRLGEGEKWRNLVPLRFEDYVEADDLIPLLERNGLGDFDLVLHLGACASTTETDAAFLIRNNYEFSKDLAGWALDRGARFIYASSAATYGAGEGGMSDGDDSASALSRLRPLNMYGYSKHLFDLWAARTGLLDHAIGLKYFNVFGPNEAHKGDMRSLVAKAIPQIAMTGNLQLFRSHRPEYADGEQLRDFLYVQDATAMTLHLAQHPSAAGLFNIGSGVASTWLDVAEALFAALDRETAVEFIDMPERLRAKYQYFTRADLSKLRETGYEEEVTPLPDAIREYVREYLLPDRRLGEEPDGGSPDR